MSTRVCTWPNKRNDTQAADEEDEPEQQPAGLLSGDPHHDDEQGEEQQRRAEVAGPTITMMATTQAMRIGSRNCGSGRWNGPILPARAGDQLTVLGEVAGEEDGQRQLGELARLEVGPEADPDAGAAERRRRRGRPVNGRSHG